MPSARKPNSPAALLPTAVEGGSVDPFFELLKLNSGKLAGTDVPQPLKPLADETVTDLGLARPFQRYDVCGP